MDQESMSPIQAFKKKAVLPFLSKLDELTRELEGKFEKPQFIINKGRKSWRYPSPSLEHICIQRMYRILSGIYACSNLLSSGQIQEIGVILRTINEFQQDIVFLLEDYKHGQPNEAQKKFVDEILKEGYIDPEVPFKGATSRETMPRKKVVASVGRHFGMGENPSDFKQITDLETDIFGGFVHAVYPCVMDIYGFDPENPRYHTFGVLTSGIFLTWSSQIMVYLDRVFHRFYLMAHHFDLEDLGQRAITLRDSWEEVAKEFGYHLPEDERKAMRKIKLGKPIS